MSVPTVVFNLEPHNSKFWDSEDVIMPFLVEPTLNGTKIPLLVVGSSTCIAISKQPIIPFPSVRKELFIVQLIVCGEVVQVDPGGM